MRRRTTLPGERVPLLRPAEVADQLGVSQARVWRLADLGRLVPSVRTAGGHARFTAADIKAYLAARKP